MPHYASPPNQSSLIPASPSHPASPVPHRARSYLLRYDKWGAAAFEVPEPHRRFSSSPLILETCCNNVGRSRIAIQNSASDWPAFFPTFRNQPLHVRKEHNLAEMNWLRGSCQEARVAARLIAQDCTVTAFPVPTGPHAISFLAFCRLILDARRLTSPCLASPRLFFTRAQRS